MRIGVEEKELEIHKPGAGNRLVPRHLVCAVFDNHHGGIVRRILCDCYQSPQAH